MPKLPDKPSELIRLAMHDLKKVERMPKKYIVNMSTWHSPAKNGKCAVCFAGSVMACSMKEDPERELDPGELYDEAIQQKYYALNEFRLGQIKLGIAEIYGRHMLSARLENKIERALPYLPEKVKVAKYKAKDKKARRMFHADMEKLASMLEAVGI